MFNKEMAKQRKYDNKDHIDKMTTRLLNYYLDPNKKGRLATGLCKHCGYIVIERIGGAAITMKNCEECGEEMVFSNTNTDRLCQKCAVEVKHCKHCGQKLD